MGAVSDIRPLLNCLPLESVEYAFAYGSGVLQQQNEIKADKMVDFILCVRDPRAFHRENLKQNGGHYSLLRLAGANSIAALQTKIAARVYFNTHVKVGSRVIKYGVVSTDDLRADLLDWRWLYVAGRLQKPVLDVIPATKNLIDCVHENRRSALQTALLLLPDQFSVRDLLKQIVAISYTGDFRMTIGEDRNKIEKIVDGSFDELSSTYHQLLEEDSRIAFQRDGTILQDASTSAIYHRLNLLPSTVLEKLQARWNRRVAKQRDTEEVLFSLAHRHDVSTHLLSAIRSIVAPTALSQTAKNALSAGITRSAIYSVAKLGKMLKSFSK